MRAPRRLSLLVVFALFGLAALGPPAALAASPNNNPSWIYLLDNNAENFPQPAWPATYPRHGAYEECRGDWRKFYYYMRDNPVAPDVLVFQQGRQENWDFYKYMLSFLGAGNYDYVTTPRTGTELVNTDCTKDGPNELKKIQLNAVFYRTDRFTRIDGAGGTWTSIRSTVDGSCVEQEDPSQRTRNLGVRLQDRISGKTIKVASIHWPSANSGENGAGNDCAQSNAARALNRIALSGDDLQIVAGDTNKTDLNWQTSNSTDKYPWYTWMTTFGRFRDTARYACDTLTSDPNCLQNGFWTGAAGPPGGAVRRRDFVFARRADGSWPRVSWAHTPAWDDWALPYSAHRALATVIWYTP